LLVCLKCWQKKEECKCNSMDYAEIDNKIYPAIKELNLLGYRTIFCCEGHIDNGSIQAYIYFAGDKNEQWFEELPEGWQYDSYTYKKIKHYKYNIIRSIIPDGRKIKKLTDEQKEEIIDRNIYNLIKWTKELSKK